MTEPVPSCSCGSTAQVIWSHAFSAWLCPTCLNTATWRELDPPHPPQKSASHCVVYCAPGRREQVLFTLALQGEPDTEVREHPWLASSEAFRVVSGLAREPDTPESAPVRRCHLCGSAYGHHPACYAHALQGLSSTGPYRAITGIM